jgi:hypothetical protein
MMPPDVRRRLEAALNRVPDEPISTWKPDVHDAIFGEAVDDVIVETRFNKEGQRRLTVRTDDGLVHVFASSKMLAEELTKKDPHVGDWVAIQRLPDGKTANGNTFKRYAVVVERQAVVRDDELPDAPLPVHVEDENAPVIATTTEPITDDEIPF